jgi:O-succinylbenzoic acid--CoA ligase
LLRNEPAVAWLKSFRIIFLGGAPAWPALLDAAAARQLPVSLGYGMTESAAMVTALRPAEFLAGVRSNGSVLPHATVAIDADDRIVLGGPSLFRGYYPAWRDPAGFPTQDRGQLDASGHLHVLGRIDAVIITGGEKVEPGELEAVLRGTGQFPDVVVVGLPDARWGQQVVAVYPGNAHPNFHQVIPATNRLADYKRPKRFIPLVGPWPANPQGKINRAELTERVIAQLKQRR